MYMIRHDDSNTKIELDAVVMKATFQDDGPDTLGQNPPVIGTKCYEVLLIVALQMRKLPTIESLRHGLCGDSRAIGCYRERSFTIWPRSVY